MAAVITEVDSLIERLRAERRRRQHDEDRTPRLSDGDVAALHTLSEDPLGDATEARLLLDGLFKRLEIERDGEEEDGN